MKIRDVSLDGADKEYFEEDCIMLLKELTNYFMTNSETVYTIMRNSGKDYNDFGRYQECENLAGFNYILATVDPKLKLSNPLSVGLCLPSVCKETDMNSLKPIIVPSLNKAFPDLFKDVGALNLDKLELTYRDIKFVNSVEMNERVHEFNKFKFFTIFVILGIIGFNITASVLSH